MRLGISEEKVPYIVDALINETRSLKLENAALKLRIQFMGVSNANRKHAEPEYEPDGPSEGVRSTTRRRSRIHKKPTTRRRTKAKGTAIPRVRLGSQVEEHQE